MTGLETESKTGPDTTWHKRKNPLTKKRLRVVLGVVLAVLILAPILVPFSIPWTQINCRHQDINIKTGQARYSRYLWFAKISEEIKDTPISVALGGKVIDVADIQAWHRVNTFSPGLGHSPHYGYHGAFAQANLFEKVVVLVELGPEEKREIAENILKLWQEGRGYFPVEDYLQTVFEERRKLSEQK